MNTNLCSAFEESLPTNLWLGDRDNSHVVAGKYLGGSSSQGHICLADKIIVFSSGIIELCLTRGIFKQV